MTLTEIKKQKEILTQREAELRSKYEASIKAIAWDKAELKRIEDGVMGGLDWSRITHAEHLVSVGEPTHPNDNEAIDDAIKDLVSGCLQLKSRYFGCKDYAQWSHQREDHEYGFGPKHGSMVFRVGLTKPIRDRLNSGDSLSAQEIEDCVYLLEAAKRGLWKSNRAS